MTSNSWVYRLDRET